MTGSDQQPVKSAEPTASSGAIGFARWLVTDARVAAKALRFGIVGLSSGLIFAVATSILVSVIGLDARAASVLAYVTSMPVNFIGHRHFTFRSEGHVIADGFRFVLLHLANMAVTAGAMTTAVNSLGLHYAFGIIGAVVLVPLSNFLLMSYWVFVPSRIKST